MATKKSGAKGKKSFRDALALLKADHETVSELLDKYEKGKERMEDEKKSELAHKICEELKVHAQIEEEIFYPALREASEEAEDALAEASVEHASIKSLVEQVESDSPESEEFDAKVKVIGEYVKHHVKEEQNELFPMAREADLDLKELGEQLAARKAELKGEAGESGGEEEAAA
jgi:hemerythrin-like domain-containing protein